MGIECSMVGMFVGMFTSQSKRFYKFEGVNEHLFLASVFAGCPRFSLVKQNSNYKN